MQYYSEETDILNSIRLIFQALRLFSVEADKRVGLSAAQLFVLEQVRTFPGVSLNELALRTATHQSSVSVVVQKLYIKKLVLKSFSPLDARQTNIKLSSTGSKLLKKGPPSFQDRFLKSLGHLSPNERKALSKILKRLVIDSGFQTKSKTPPLFFEAPTNKKRLSSKKNRRKNLS